MLKIPDSYVADAVYRSIIYYLAKCLGPSSCLKVIYVVAKDTALLDEVAHRFDEHIASNDPHRTIILHLDHKLVDDAILACTCPPVPPKTGIQQVSRGPIASYQINTHIVARDNGGRSSSSSVSSSSSSSPETGINSPKGTKPRGRNSTVKKQRTAKSSQNGKHVMVYSRKSSCFSCFKSKKETPRYEITIEDRASTGTEQINRVNKASRGGYDVGPPPSGLHDDGGFSNNRTSRRY